MENVSRKEKFFSMAENLREEQNLIQKNISAISTLRVISFLAGAAFFLTGAADGLLWAEISGVIFLLIFVYLVKKHSDEYGKAEIAAAKLRVVEAYVKRFNGEWNELAETGEEFMEKSDTLVTDLDLMGDNSLYRMICVAHTEKGKQRLADTVKLENVHPEDIKKRNEAIRELIEKTEFAVEFESSGIRLENKKQKLKENEFIEYCQDEKKGILPPWAAFARYILPALVMISLFLFITGVTNYGILLLAFIFALAFSWLTKNVTDGIIKPLYCMGYGLESYLYMIKLVDKTDFTSDYLAAVKERIGGEDGVLTALSKLEKIARAYNICYNPLIHQLLNGFFLWDYHLAALMEKWKKKYGKNAAGCFDDIALTEELLSLSVLGVVRNVSWADIDITDGDGVRLSFKNLRHPLISTNKAVSNSVEDMSGTNIVTGSNMSGKTTFLRMIAVNLALAYMGAPVCGEKFSASYMKIFTSMRVTDDVANGISTFYAEILRIKAMAEYREKNQPMICFIDEIFKGTNSADRIVGAKEAIKKLSGKNCITIVSTHDFELCDIKDMDGQPAYNYHFEEYYETGELKFDYHLKKGRCTTTNAKELLRMAGFSV